MRGGSCDQSRSGRDGVGAAVVWVEGWGDREVEWMDRSRLDDKRWGIHCLSFR